MKKFFSLFLSVVMLLSITAGIDFSVSAASYNSDYKRWSQGKSSYSWMRNYGCWVVAEAKLIYETGINKTSSFNPDVYYKWATNKGYVNNGGNVYSDNPVRYAKSLGNNKLSYEGVTTSNLTNKVINNAKSGYYSIIKVKTSSGGTHYIMANNSKTKSTGKIYIYDSWNSANEPPATFAWSDIKSKVGVSYTMTAVYTFKYGGSSAITNPSVTNVTIKFDGNGGTASATKLSNIKDGGIMGSKIPTATRYGYIFDGWYTAKNGGTKYTNSRKITSNDNNRTLYAHWISKLDNGCTGDLKAGHLYRIVNKKSGYVLQPDSDSNGALVKQREITNTNRQIWKVGFSGGCVFYNGYGGKCLDISGQSVDNGALLQIYGTDTNNRENRIFSLVSRGSGYYSIHPNHSGRAFDIKDASTSIGAQAQQYYFTGNSQQLFSFQEVTNRRVEFYDNLSN
ncbi:MAG: RICIN domain-containing protein, partial [Eubacterium sp.]|nr:RICIN domain-containing protein [Eubacterium sp.]